MNISRSELMEQLGLEAGARLKDFFGKGIEIKKKGVLDLVTLADETAEKLVVDGILAHFPQDAILAEEGGAREGSNAYQWIIDPLDGTTNFAHSFPHFSVSIALARDNQIIAGLVYDPMKNEMFKAQLGQGATLNGNPISVGIKRDLGESLGVTGFSYDRRERMDFLLDRVRMILNNCQGLRRLGSAALDLAYIASGRFDVFVEDGLNAWDMAAGALLVTEAGGSISMLNGDHWNVHGHEVLACNANLLPQALQSLISKEQEPGDRPC